MTPVAGQDVFATFSQGFQLPDVGLQLRNATIGFGIGNSSLQPVRIDSYEIGWRGRFGAARTTVSAFRTTSELGDVQSLNNGLVLVRTAERIRGVEGSLDVGAPQDRIRAGATATWITGRERPANAAASSSSFRRPRSRIRSTAVGRASPTATSTAPPTV